MASVAKSGVEKALQLLKSLPRVALANIKPLPGERKKIRLQRGKENAGRYLGRAHKGQRGRNYLPPIGYEGGQIPFHIRIPSEPYYYGYHVRRQYPPLSLLQLQRLIDLGRIDSSEPIDLTLLCNTKVITVDPQLKHYGINITDEGVDSFAARINLEVQWISELAIAAIERCGGTVTTKYYDIECVQAMVDPEVFFKKGLPIPKCKLPPADAVEYYSNPENRGYLADPAKIREARLVLAQKYGYKLPDFDGVSDKMFMRRKDPRQIWYGLEPGWVVNLRDKLVLKPTDEVVKTYYKS